MYGFCLLLSSLWSSCAVIDPINTKHVTLACNKMFASVTSMTISGTHIPPGLRLPVWPPNVEDTPTIPVITSAS